MRAEERDEIHREIEHEKRVEKHIDFHHRARKKQIHKHEHLREHHYDVAEADPLYLVLLVLVIVDFEIAEGSFVAVKVSEIETYSIEEIVARAKKPGLLVALDGIQDPHNVGAILRTCDCTGVDGVILTKHNSCGLTPTVVKASTGAAYTIPVSIVTNLSQTLRNLKQDGYWVVGTDMKDAREYREGMYDSPTVLVIGSEGQGISNLVKKQCDYMVYLPMVGSITSLNASVAAAVLMYEVYNQRNPKK